MGWPYFGCSHQHDMTWLWFDRDMFGVLQPITSDFEKNKTDVFFVLTKFHPFGCSAHHHFLVTNRETIIGVDMPGQHNLETSKLEQAVATRKDFHLARKGVAFNCRVKNQDPQLRASQNAFRINYLDLI